MVGAAVAAGVSYSLAAGVEPGRRAARPSTPAAPAAVQKPIATVPPLPPLPDGVMELKFENFFKMPVGPRGLELTENVRGLNGKKVRILGFQVAELVSNCNADGTPLTPARKAAAWFEASVPGRLLLCPTPQRVNFAHYGHADDLPPQVLYVTVPEKAGEPMPHTPGLLLLTGTLEVGPKQEPDGRISVVRLTLDPPPASSTADSPNPVQPIPAAPPGSPEAAHPTPKTTTK